MKIRFLFIILTLLFIFPAGFSAQDTADVQFEGQIVCCADCWAEADRTEVEYGTAEDLLKSQSCVENGDPTLIAVREGNKFTLYQLEQGKFKLQEKNWLSYIGKRVSVSGTIKKKNIFVVNSLEVRAESIAAREAKAAIGQEVELTLNDLFGTPQNLNQYKGRIVILNFWATFCVPCREEMPDLAKIQNEYAALGVQVIGASTDELSSRPKVLTFIKETKVNFPIWMGATADDMTRFGLGEALPGTVIVDKSGKIVKVISGIVNVEDMRTQIDSMLEMAESKVERVEETVAQKDTKPKSSKVSTVPS